MSPKAAIKPPEGDWLGTPYLRFERKGPIGVVTIDRPELKNAFTGAMYFGIGYAVNLVNRDAALAGVLITGVGEVFACGGDLSRNDVDWWMDFSLLGMRATPFDAIRNSAKPVVSAVNGLAQGGGLMISMLSDVSVASEKATFRAPELFRGIADNNYAQILPRQIGPARARDMLLTGRTVSAAEAEDWGLVSRICAHDEVYAKATEVLEWAIRTAPDARREVKRVIDGYYGTYPEQPMVDSLYSPEAAEGFRAFKERRSPSWVPTPLRLDGRL